MNFMNPFTPKFTDLPPTLPVFPLNGVLLLPGGSLPLNIFEPRYIAMIDAALAAPGRLIGMIQPADFEYGSSQKAPALQKIGCAGRISELHETPDGRYEITLSGICRFKVDEELSVTTAYRQVRPDWRGFEADSIPHECEGLCKDRLKDLLKDYFQVQGMNCDWSKVDEAPKEKLLTCLSMICPFEPSEKQALLEAPSLAARADILFKLLEFAVAGNRKPGDGATRH